MQKIAAAILYGNGDSKTGLFSSVLRTVFVKIEGAFHLAIRITKYLLSVAIFSLSD